MESRLDRTTMINSSLYCSCLQIRAILVGILSETLFTRTSHELRNIITLPVNAKLKTNNFNQTVHCILPLLAHHIMSREKWETPVFIIRGVVIPVQRTDRSCLRDNIQPKQLE